MKVDEEGGGQEYERDVKSSPEGTSKPTRNPEVEVIVDGKDRCMG